MLRTYFVSCLALLAVNGAAVPPIKRGISLEVVSKAAFAPASEDAISTNVLTLTKSSKQSRSNTILAGLMKGDDVTKRQAPSGSLTAALGGQEYLVSIEWGSESYTAILDTGSSDTWLIQSGFTCLDANDQQQPDSTCNFGPPFTGTYNDGQINDKNFNISYGDGEFVSGTVGYEDVTLAGITVSKQEVALGNMAYWQGDGTSSGLVGLAYESLTSAYSGTNPAGDSNTNRDNYPPIFQSMYTQGLTSASFSLALERSTGGYIAFGGLPPVSGISSSTSFTSTPIQYLSLVNPDQYTFYAITASIEYNKKSSSSGQYIVDSGTTLIYTPTTLAKEINSAFSPAAQYLSDQGAYFVDCHATPPTLEVNIAGTRFTVNPVDLIYQSQVDQNTGLCLTGIQDGGSGPYILGDVFLQNVVAVFDVGANEMRFAAHEMY